MSGLFGRKRKHEEEESYTKLSSGERVVTLNAQETKESDFVVRKRIVFQFLQTSIRPVEGTLVGKVVLNSQDFWERRQENGECTCVRTYSYQGDTLFLELVLKKEENTTFEYFYRDYYKWVSTSPEKYSKMFSNFVDLYYLRVKQKLNINGKVDPNHFLVNKSLGPQFYVISPKQGVWVGRVVEGIVDIWEKNYKGEVCLSALVFHKEGNPLLCHILVKTIDSVKQELYFKKEGITWPRITKEEYLKKLDEYGYDREKFNTKVTLELENPGELFTQENFDARYIKSAKIAPKNGFQVVKVHQGEEVIWESEKKFITFVNYTKYEGYHSLLTLFVKNGNETQLEKYAKLKDGKWERVDDNKFEALYSQKDKEYYTHKNVGLDEKGERKMVMSHFTNKNGLKINTYSSKVENEKGVMILVHGAFGHFLSDFASYRLEHQVKYENYKPVSEVKSPEESDNNPMNSYNLVYESLTNHKECFEYREFDGLNMFETSDRHEYKRSFTEGVNNMGYTVYGMDHGSHGLSESLTSEKFYANSFMDYIDDLLQYIEIVRRGKFYDTKQTYEDYKNRKEEEYEDKRMYLVGYSMGGNLCLRTVNEYYKRTKSTKKLFDGVILLSGMYKLYQLNNPVLETLALMLVSVVSLFIPKVTNLFQGLFDYSCSYDALNRYRDPNYSYRQCKYKTLLMVIKSSFDLKKNVNYYPENLPTLLINSVEDPTVHIDGAREIVKYIKNSKLVEVEGNVHGLPLSQYVPVVTEILNEWLSGPSNL